MSSMNAKVFYHSHTGKTKTAAEAIAKEFRILCTKIEAQKRGSFFMNGYRALKRKKVEILPTDLDTKDFDTLIIGGPVWAGNATPAINTLIDKLDLKGKKVIIFVTAGGSDAGKSLNNMTEDIVNKGGNVSGSFLIRSSGLSDTELSSKAIENIKSILK